MKERKNSGLSGWIACGVFAFGFLAPPGFAQTAGQIPALLDAMESNTEDAFDHALQSDKAKARELSVLVEQNWQGYRQDAARAGASAEDIYLMNQAVGHLMGTIRTGDQILPLARAANAVTGLIDRFIILYHTSVPPVIHRLDFWGRELLLDGMEPSFTQASSHLAAARNQWQQLKQILLKRGEASEAIDQFEKTNREIEQAIKAKDASHLVDAAKVYLENVDTLEKLF